MEDDLRVVFRADATARTGLGHLFRSIALAGGIKSRGVWDVLFCGRIEIPIAQNKLKIEGLKALEAPVNPSQELTSILGISRPGDWIVLDGYDFGIELQRGLKTAGRKVMVIQDFAEGSFWADIVLNHNLSAEKLCRYHLKAGGKALLGSSYCLLRREFWNLAEPPSFESRERSVSVFLGGGDHPLKLYEKIIDGVLGALPQDHRLELILANKPDPSFSEMLASRGPALMIKIALDGLKEVFLHSRVAIVTAGSSVWEAVACGCPLIVGKTAANQDLLEIALLNEKAAFSLGYWETANSTTLGFQVRDLILDEEKWRKQSSKLRSLVDGNGVFRVIQEMELIA